jgi:membrane protease YdiL (CAAX protease family)
MRKYLLILFSLCFFLSEILLRISPVGGFISYSVLIAGCLISFAKEEALDERGKLMIVLMIIPIMRIAELFISFDYVWRSFIVYYILLFLVVFYSLKFKINPGYIKKGFGWLPLVVILGVVIGVIGDSLLNLNIKYPEFLFLLPVIAFSEEVLFRGLIQNLVQKSFGTFSSIFFTSLLYGIFSLSLGIGFALFFFAVSLITCIIYHKTKNIYLVVFLNLIVHLFILVLQVWA